MVKLTGIAGAFVIVSGLLLLGGCANPIVRVTYDRYMATGTSAEIRGDLSTAEEAYRRAYLNTQWGNLSKEEQFISLKDWGRVKQRLGKDSEAKEILTKAETIADQAYIDARGSHIEKEDASRITYHVALLKRDLCKLRDAEALLKEALTLEEQIQKGDRPEISKRLCELAHLYFEQGKYGEAVQSFKRCVRMVQRMGMERDSPAMFAYAVGEYVEALRKVDRAADSVPWQAAYDRLMATSGVKGIPVSPWQHPPCPK